MTQTIQKLAERDGAVLVSNLAGELLKLPPQQKSMSTTSRRVHKRGSSSVSSGSTVVGSPTNSTTLLNPLIYYDTKERIGLENTGSMDNKGGRGGSARMSDMGTGGSGGSGSGNRRLYRGSGVLRAPSQPNPPSPRIGSRTPSFVGDLGGN